MHALRGGLADHAGFGPDRHEVADLAAEGVFDLVQDRAENAGGIVAEIKTYRVEGVAEQPWGGDEKYFRGILSKAIAVESCLNEDPERRAVPTTVIAVVQRDYSEAVMGEEFRARGDFADAVEVDAEHPDAVIEAMPERSMTDMGDPAGVQRGWPGNKVCHEFCEWEVCHGAVTPSALAMRSADEMPSS